MVTRPGEQTLRNWRWGSKMEFVSWIWIGVGLSNTDNLTTYSMCPCWAPWFVSGSFVDGIESNIQGGADAFDFLVENLVPRRKTVEERLPKLFSFTVLVLYFLVPLLRNLLLWFHFNFCCDSWPWRGLYTCCVTESRERPSIFHCALP